MQKLSLARCLAGGRRGNRSFFGFTFLLIAGGAAGLSSCRSLSMQQGLPPYGMARTPQDSAVPRTGFPYPADQNWMENMDNADPAKRSNRIADSSAGVPQVGSPISGPRPTYFKQVAPSAWRCKVPADQLFALVARHLSGSYILAQTDSGSRTIVTEWDKFFIGSRLFRNKISVNLFAVSPFETELLVMNKLEYFQQSSERQAYGESDWFPTQDITNERAQLIESLSSLLHALNLASAPRIPVR
jgi:hypothetical protein